ncbi:MAG: GTP-binding protein, partial [Actinomycetota bacterium]|nr:GTP-binding protein [Actinomycetota bacterium]
MRVNDVRNIAIIAHVDHGKTTLVDRLLQTTHVFRDNQQVAERVLDSNDQERERGITILAKNISIRWRDVKINVIDTPGHADFGGEVERVLKMADGCLLIVDAFEGPMPQTRFVLRHALEHGLKPMVVVNKIDRPGARPHEVIGDVFDLMVDLGANDEQLDFPIIYTSAVNGYARNEPDDGNDDMTPLLDAILEHIPAPDVDSEGPVAMQVCTVDYSSFVGRIGIGRIFSGTLHSGDKILVIKNDGTRYQASVKQLLTFEGMGRIEAESAHAGDLVAVVGVEDADIGDMFTCRIDPITMAPIHVEEPTMSVVFAANTSPLVGREGTIVGARQIKERLLKEAESNISMRIQETPAKDGMEVAGRGVLHLSVLMETMRREGYEFQVGRPQVILKQEGGRKLEPIEQAVVDVPSVHAGKVIEIFGSAGGEMVDMVQRDEHVHLEFRIPSRGVMGLRTRILNGTRGE